MMSIVLPLVPFAAIVGYGLGVITANAINRGDLRRLRFLSRYTHALELQQQRDHRYIRQLRAALAERRSTAETVARKPPPQFLIRRVA